MTANRGEHENMTRSLVGRPESALRRAARWAANRVGRSEHRDTGGNLPVVHHRPPAPVQGDAGARAAGSVEDNITEEKSG